MKILIVDDDPQILRALRITLSARGYEVVTARTGAEALNTAVDEHPDLCLLDLGLPELDGVDAIHALRGWSSIPIIVVSGRAGAADKVGALDAGADDYVTKPFAIDELLARIRALSRRSPQAPEDPVAWVGDLRIDIAARTITRSVEKGEEHIHLTPTEWEVLTLLVRSPGRLVTRETILNHIWGVAHGQDTGYLRLYIRQLRKKIESDPSNPRAILTETGMGYRFQPDA